ncbi:4006_t:CDS:2 [Ambispora leptoticha]|uniref:4006_t:CDS:1 n=1 Tax=Ambispora leptoticha TaxID=144679 RepID=A0A9N9C8F7_9GLOM|nr:4006_t:CDS:2 [Ambispora leptoticha]
MNCSFDTGTAGLKDSSLFNAIWTARKKSKRSSDVQIGRLQVKKVKHLATGGQMFNNGDVTLRMRQEKEEASIKKDEPSSTNITKHKIKESIPIEECKEMISNSDYVKNNRVFSEDIENILENHKANYEEKDELAEDEFEKSLTEADIINISSNRPSLMSKELLSRLKEEAQSQPPPRIKVDGLKKNENDVPSSKWRREMIYQNSNASARKADGILFNYENTSQESLLFENIGPPLKTKNPKYNGDLLKCFRNSVDSICKTFWNGNGDVEFAKKYYVLAYVLHKDKGELFRLNLGAPKTFVAERILTVHYSFEYSTFPCIVGIIDLLLTVKAIFESNMDVLHDYSKSCMEISNNFTPVREWLSLNRNSL